MIKFTHDFKKDLQQIYLHGEPYAFIRYGDGERSIGCHKPIKSGRGEYDYNGSDTHTSRKIMQSLTADIGGLYLGISCPCCDVKAFVWYLAHVHVPRCRLTYANLFVNANYQEFQKLDLKNTVLVSCKNGDFTIPEHAMNPEWDYKPLLQQLFKVDKPILVAAGPIKCGLIYDYWLTAPNRQIIIDVGSALDCRIHGKPTRRYHNPEYPTAKRVCRWTL